MGRSGVDGGVAPGGQDQGQAEAAGVRDHYKRHEVKIADGPLAKFMNAVQFWDVGEEWQRILEDTLEWLKELKAFISSEPAFSSFWFTSELSTTLLAKECKKMKQQKKKPKV